MIALALVALLSGSAGQPAGGVVSAQVTVAQSVIIRVPARRSRHYVGDPSAPPRSPPAMQSYREHRGPKCIDAGAIAGAAVLSPDSVDFILKGGRRVRAKLADECPALDYYSGVYVKPPRDGQICADRDSIHTRSGGDCQVDKFRILTPVPPPR